MILTLHGPMLPKGNNFTAGGDVIFEKLISITKKRQFYLLNNYFQTLSLEILESLSETMNQGNDKN